MTVIHKKRQSSSLTCLEAAGKPPGETSINHGNVTWYSGVFQNICVSKARHGVKSSVSSLNVKSCVRLLAVRSKYSTQGKTSGLL